MVPVFKPQEIFEPKTKFHDFSMTSIVSNDPYVRSESIVPAS